MADQKLTTAARLQRIGHRVGLLLSGLCFVLWMVHWSPVLISPAGFSFGALFGVTPKTFLWGTLIVAVLPYAFVRAMVWCIAAFLPS